MHERFPFISQQRVRYADLDGQGIVFYGHYFTYIDVAINQFVAATGIDYASWTASTGLDFNVVNVLLNYHAPLQFDELITVGLRLDRMGRSSITWQVALFRSGESEPAASGEIVWVCADQTTHTSQPLPDGLRRAFLAVGQDD